MVCESSRQNEPAVQQIALSEFFGKEETDNEEQMIVKKEEKKDVDLMEFFQEELDKDFNAGKQVEQSQSSAVVRGKMVPGQGQGARQRSPETQETLLESQPSAVAGGKMLPGQDAPQRSPETQETVLESQETLLESQESLLDSQSTLF